MTILTGSREIAATDSRAALATPTSPFRTSNSRRDLCHHPPAQALALAPLPHPPPPPQITPGEMTVQLCTTTNAGTTATSALSHGPPTSLGTAPMPSVAANTETNTPSCSETSQKLAQHMTILNDFKRKCDKFHVLRSYQHATTKGLKRHQYFILGYFFSTDRKSVV